MDTDWTLKEDSGFNVLRDEFGSPMRVAFGDRFSYVYVASEEAKSWDGVPESAQAIGSRFGCYCYAEIRVTGKRMRYVRKLERMATSARISFYNDGPGGSQVLGKSIAAWVYPVEV